MDSIVPVVLAGLIIGLAKGGLLGPIAGALILPLLSQVMTVTEAVGVTLPLLMFADVFAVRFFWREWDLEYIRLMLPVALIGVVMGTVLLASLSDNALRVILGVLTLLIVAYKLTSNSLSGRSYTHRKWHGYLAGWGSGFASSLANAGGPPATAYLLLQGINPTAFVGTLALFFAVLNWTKVPGFFAAGIMDVDLLVSILWVLPIIPFGVWLGRKAVGWIDPRIFDSLMTVLLFIAALILLFT